MVETLLVLLLTALFTVAVLVVITRVTRHAPLDLVDHLVVDAGGRYLHIFGRKTYMPDDADSFSVFHHLLLDLDTLELISGEKQRGEDLELDSPFVERSMAEVSRRLGTPLALRRGDKGEDPLPVIARKATHTDTERPKSVPANAVIIWTVSDTPARFDLEIRRDASSLARWPIKGRGEEPWLKQRWFPERGLLVMTYYRDMGVRSGTGLLVIDMQRTAIRSDGFLRIGAPKLPRRRHAVR